MNANSSPLAPITIRQWLAAATLQLTEVGVSSARLDALVLLEDELGKDRAWLLAHDDEIIVAETLKVLNKKVIQRSKRIPLSYIRGFVEFYGRTFTVNPRVLIPRPETEEMIDLIKGLDLSNLPKQPVLIDVGAGSGCIGITAKLERAELDVYVTDINEDALGIANHNARQHKVRLQYYPGDLLEARYFENYYSIITANLPYVTKGFEISPDAHHEPALALYANDEGYELIERLLPQAVACLLPGGYMLLESDPWQQDRIITKASQLGFRLVEQRRFHLVLKLID